MPTGAISPGSADNGISGTMGKRRVHAKLIGDRYTFCGRFMKDVQFVEFRAASFIDGQPSAKQMDCKACWNMAA
jgi:hypothetical protein